MTGGKIIDWFTRDGITKFLVKDDNDTCTVRGRITDPCLDKIDIGAMIWWQSDKVYIDFFGKIERVGYLPFPKISTSGGNGLTFYQDKYKTD